MKSTEIHRISHKYQCFMPEVTVSTHFEVYTVLTILNRLLKCITILKCIIILKCITILKTVRLQSDVPPETYEPLSLPREIFEI
jgi:hypothetical protein